MGVREMEEPSPITMAGPCMPEATVRQSVPTRFPRVPGHVSGITFSEVHDRSLTSAFFIPDLVSTCPTEQNPPGVYDMQHAVPGRRQKSSCTDGISLTTAFSSPRRADNRPCA
jgi:hypothetical protein